MQGIEIRNAFGIETDNFGINNQRLTEPSRFLDNAWIALSPISAVHGVEPHPSVANMDLQAVAIVLEFMHPAIARWRLLGDSRTTGLDEGGWRVSWPAA
ncbi:MAG: hypothetical protein WBC84_07835 [Pseudolabrys sp.]